MGIFDRLRGKNSEPVKPESGDEQYERITGAKKKNDELWEKATGAKQYHKEPNKEPIKDKAEQARIDKLEKRKQDLAWRKKELSVREDEARLNRRESRLNNGWNAGSSFSFNPNAGGNLLDMGFSGGSYTGGSKGGFDIFSTDIGGGGLFGGTGMAPRKKHRRANKKNKTTKRKNK